MKVVLTISIILNILFIISFLCIAYYYIELKQINEELNLILDDVFENDSEFIN